MTRPICPLTARSSPTKTASELRSRPTYDSTVPGVCLFSDHDSAQSIARGKALPADLLGARQNSRTAVLYLEQQLAIPVAPNDGVDQFECHWSMPYVSSSARSVLTNGQHLCAIKSHTTLTAGRRGRFRSVPTRFVPDQDPALENGHHALAGVSIRHKCRTPVPFASRLAERLAVAGVSPQSETCAPRQVSWTSVRATARARS